MRYFRLVLFALIVASFSLSALAQSVDTAGLEVDVHDPSGALVSGATLTLSQVGSADVRTGVTDAHGRYRFAEVPPGDYVLTSTRTGFAETKQTGITLAVGQSSTLTMAMTVASSDSVVQVNANVSTVDPDRTTIGQTISQVEIMNLPSDGRNFLDFAISVPGVTPTATTGQNSGFSVNGQRSRSNSIMIDGVENNGQLNGNVRLTPSQDAIAQFQVLTEQFPAEYGGAGGGFINVITKAGSNQYHGGAYYFERNNWLNWPNAFATATPGTYQRNDIGGTLGGPIKGDRTTFFGSLEYIGINTSRAGTISNSVAANVNAALATGIFKGSSIKSVGGNGYIPQSSAQTLASLRLDRKLSDRDTLVGRVMYLQYIQASNINAGAYYDVTASAGTYTHTQNYYLEETHIFKPTLLNEVHLMVAPQRLKELPFSSGPGADIGGYLLFGPTADFPVTLNEDHYEGDDALTWTRGSHLFKFGAQINYIRAFSYFPTDFNGYWSFTSSTTFGQGAPYEYIQSFGNPNITLPDTIMGYYAEDSWKATSRLTLNLGVRYDLDLQPQGLNTDPSNAIETNLSHGIPRDFNNFAPRLGLAYSIDKTGKTVLRAGYGMFYDKNLLILARNTLEPIETLILTSTTPVTATAQFKNGPLPQSATFPTGAGGPPSISRADPGMVIPFLHQADFGIDRAITRNMVLSATYVYVAGEKLLKETNANLGPPVILTAANATALCACTPSYQQLGRPYYTSSNRFNPNFNNINEVGPWGHSNYNGLRTTLVQQAEHGVTFRFGWVWSRAEDDAADFLNGAYADNQYFQRAEKSLSNEDVRNRFTASLVYRDQFHSRRKLENAVLGNWVFAGIMTGGSATPEDITVGTDVNGDENFSDRPFINGKIVGRNTFRGGRQSSVSLRGQKEFRLPRAERLTFSAECFNTFNHVNYSSFSTIWGTAQAAPSTFGQPLAAGNSRDIQLGVRYQF